MPSAYTLPRNPLGNFVRAHYSAAKRKGAYTKLSKSGFVPPSPSGGGGGGSTARNRLLPPELIGVEGVRGPFFGITPRLNPNDYIFHTNDRGRIFAEPITELTGLSPIARKQVGEYDRRTAAQVPQIQGAYTALQGELNANADAAKARLASLGSLIQGSAPVQGAVQGVPDVDAQLAQARRAEQGAGAAVTVGQMSALPQIAAQEGTRAVEDWNTTRGQGRTELVGGLQQQRAQAAAAQAEAQMAQRELAAQLRGQDLQLLGTQISQQGGLQRALVQAETSRSNKMAELENRLLIAELNGNVSEANSIRSQMARIQAAQIGAAARVATSGGKGGGQRAKDTKAFVKEVRAKLTGTFIRNPRWKSDALTPDEPTHIPKPGSYASPAEIVAQAATEGVRILPVLQAIRSASGGRWGRTLQEANQIYVALQESGTLPLEQIRKIVQQFTGRNPAANV